MSFDVAFQYLELALRKHYYGWEGAKQFEGTASRLLKMKEDFFWPNDKIQAKLEECFEAIYLDDYDEMLVNGPTIVWTLCPHHLLPCQFEVYIGYIPNGRVLGLSKFNRIAQILARRPVMQETYTREVLNSLWKRLTPKGAGVFVVGAHGCMTSRGVKQEALVSTSQLKGIIADRPEVRAEFYSIVNNRRYRK